VELAPTDASAFNVNDHFVVSGDDVVDVLHLHNTKSGEHECFHTILRAVLRFLIVTLQVRSTDA
jgi:hypothetical protein